MPPELWLNIGQRLADNDLLSLCLTSRRMHNDLINDLIDRGVAASKSWTKCHNTVSLGCLYACLDNHPAFWAIKNNRLSFLCRLFERGLEANVQLEKEDHALVLQGGNSTYEPWNLLTFAIHYNRVDFVRLLLDKGPDVNFQLYDKARSALNIAVWNEFSNHDANIKIVGLLLERGASRASTRTSIAVHFARQKRVNARNRRLSI